MVTEEQKKETLCEEKLSKRLGGMVIDLILFSVIFGVLLLLLSEVYQLLFGSVDSSFASREDVWALIAQEALLLVSALIASLIVLVFRKLPFAGLGLSFKGRGKDLLAGIVFAIVFYAAGFALNLLLGGISLAGFSFSPLDLLLFLFFYLVVAVTEEVMFRGFVLGRMLDAGLNKFVALFFSSVLFSLGHLFNPDFAWIPFLNIWLAGMLLGASYIYTRNLCFPIALHWFWNWLQGPVLGFGVSGIHDDNTLFTLQLSDASLINGGTFGFEGSAICTILIVAGIALIIGHCQKK